MALFARKDTDAMQILRELFSRYVGGLRKTQHFAITSDRRRQFALFPVYIAGLPQLIQRSLA